jgi:hypothetical protein
VVIDLPPGWNNRKLDALPLDPVAAWRDHAAADDS